ASNCTSQQGPSSPAACAPSAPWPGWWETGRRSRSSPATAAPPFSMNLEKDRVLWHHPCRICQDISVSEDGSRFAQSGADGLEVWDTRKGQRIFQETRRRRSVATECTLSRDGRHL